MLSCFSYAVRHFYGGRVWYESLFRSELYCQSVQTSRAEWDCRRPHRWTLLLGSTVGKHTLRLHIYRHCSANPRLPKRASSPCSPSPGICLQANTPPVIKQPHARVSIYWLTVSALNVSTSVFISPLLAPQFPLQSTSHA